MGVLNPSIHILIAYLEMDHSGAGAHPRQHRAGVHPEQHGNLLRRVTRDSAQNTAGLEQGVHSLIISNLVSVHIYFSSSQTIHCQLY